MTDISIDAAASTIPAETPAKPAVTKTARTNALGRNPFLNRPVRRRVSAAKAAMISPEARRAAEERTRKEIDDFIAQGKVRKLDARWADGAVTMNLFGTQS